CHPSREVALLRALTEAAQTRLTVIAGARDDVGLTKYAQAADGNRLVEAHRLFNLTPERRFDSIGTFNSDSFEDDLAWELGRLRSAGIDEVAVVDLTLPEFEIPVVRVVIPGLEGMSDVPGFTPGARLKCLAAEGQAGRFTSLRGRRSTPTPYAPSSATWRSVGPLVWATCIGRPERVPPPSPSSTGISRGSPPSGIRRSFGPWPRACTCSARAAWARSAPPSSRSSAWSGWASSTKPSAAETSKTMTRSRSFTGRPRRAIECSPRRWSTSGRRSRWRRRRGCSLRT